MNVIMISFLTLVIYSLSSTLLFVFSGEDEDVIMVCGLGIVGMTLLLFAKVIRKIRKLYRESKRCSLYKEVESGNVYKCKTKDSHNMDWLRDYEIVKRYKNITECEDIPWVSKEVLERSRINCDNCIYDNVCDGSINSDGSWNYHGIKCKHDMYGAVVEFDKFVKK